MTDKTLGAYQRHEKHDAADFANAEFARHPHRGIAARTRKGKMWAWIAGPMQELLRDEEMAAGGWFPVRECPDPEQHRDPLDFQTSFPSPAKGMRYQRERDEARAMAALWKETTRELAASRKRLRNAHTYWIGRAGKAEATLSLVQQQRGQATARAEKAEKERDEARADCNDALRREKAEQDRADKANRERDAAVDSALFAAVSRPLTPDAISADAYERGVPRLRAALGYDMSPLMAHEVAKDIVAAVLTEPPQRPEGAEEIDEHLRQANAAALGGALTPEQRRALADHLAGFGYRSPIGLAEDGAA